MHFLKYWFKVLGVLSGGFILLFSIAVTLQWLSDHHHPILIVAIIGIIVVTLIALITYEDLG